MQVFFKNVFSFKKCYLLTLNGYVHLRCDSLVFLTNPCNVCATCSQFMRQKIQAKLHLSATAYFM